MSKVGLYSTDSLFLYYIHSPDSKSDEWWKIRVKIRSIRGYRSSIAIRGIRGLDDPRISMLVIGLRLHKTGNYMDACQMGGGWNLLKYISSRALELVSRYGGLWWLWRVWWSSWLFFFIYFHSFRYRSSWRYDEKKWFRESFWTNRLDNLQFLERR